MKLYLKSGYLNVEGLLRQSLTFNFLIGGRGTGKTYGILKYILDQHLKVFFIRRLQSQIDIISKPEFNPFNALDRAVEIKPASKYHSAFFRNGQCIGYCAALSTFSKIRGFDASDIDIMFFDEFIPEAHERPLKNEDAALFNAYETVNRNRELDGRKPLILVCAANSNRINNEILQGFDLLPDLEKMMRKGQEVYIDQKRSILLAYLAGSPISDAKSETALYKALKGSDFEEMSIYNRFSYESARITSKNLGAYRILFRLGNLGFYVSRGGRTEFYVRETSEDARKIYGTTDEEIKRFRNENPFVGLWNVKGWIIYENLDVYTRFTRYLT